MSAQLSRDDWKSRIGGLSYRNQAFIDGKFVPSASGKTFDCINPATGQVLAKVAACDQADVDRAVKAARAAFDKGTWAQHGARRAQEDPAEARRADDRAPRASWRCSRRSTWASPSRDSTHDRHPGLGQLHRAGTPRPSTRSTTRSRPPARATRRHDHARAGRRRRRRRAVELPAAHGVAGRSARRWPPATRWC